MYVEGLEKLFHAGSLKEDEKARKGCKGVVEVNQFTKDNKGPNAPKTQKGRTQKDTSAATESHLSQLPIRERNGKNKMARMGRRSLRAEGTATCCVGTSLHQRVVSLAADVDTITPIRLASAEFVGQSLIKPRIAHVQKNPTRSGKDPGRDPRAKPRLEQEQRQSKLKQGLLTQELCVGVG